MQLSCRFRGPVNVLKILVEGIHDVQVISERLIGAGHHSHCIGREYSRCLLRTPQGPGILVELQRALPRGQETGLPILMCNLTSSQVIWRSCSSSRGSSRILISEKRSHRVRLWKSLLSLSGCRDAFFMWQSFTQIYNGLGRVLSPTHVCSSMTLELLLEGGKEASSKFSSIGCLT